jgi:hypothetical protein
MYIFDRNGIVVLCYVDADSGPGVPKLERARFGLWFCSHRDDDDHDGSYDSRHAWCLALAMAWKIEKIGSQLIEIGEDFRR